MQIGSAHPRVLMLSDVYFPRVNGVSTSIQTFRRDLLDIGCKTSLIAPLYPTQREDEPGVYRVKSRYLPFDPEDRVMSRRDFRRVVGRLAPADIVHVQTPFLAQYWGSSLARQWKAKLVVSYHTYFEQYFHHYVPAVPRSWLRMLSRAISRAQLNRVDLVIAPSEQMAHVLSEYGVTVPIEVLPTGLDPDLFGAGEGKRFRDRFGIDPGRPMLLTVGRVAFEKNLLFLLDVLECACRDVPDVLLVIAGEGPALEALKKEVARRGLASNLLFVGYLDRGMDLLDCYRSADAFVFASRTETQGLVLLEAMALGTPVISTAVMGTQSVLANAPGAIVVEERVDFFAAAIMRLLSDAGERQKLGELATQDVAANWSGAEMARRLYKMYCDLITGDNG